MEGGGRSDVGGDCTLEGSGCQAQGLRCGLLGEEDLLKAVEEGE